MICGGANDTSGCHLAAYSEDVAVAIKNYLQWWAIQLAIHSTVGARVDYK